MTQDNTKDLPVISFSTTEEWERWLEGNHAVSKGIWIRIFKKGSGVASIVYQQALDGALCYGWIDGQLKTYDDVSYIQRFTPRRPKSTWSKRNVEHVARLEGEGRMKSAGLQAVEDAKADGRWECAYDSQSNMSIPEDFVQALNNNKQALDFFESLDKVNKYSIVWRIQTAHKPATREKRIAQLLDMLKRGEKFHN